MASLHVTLIVSADEATAKQLMPYNLVPQHLSSISDLLDKAASSMRPKLKFSGEWVVNEIGLANDFEPEPATPKL